VVATSRIASAAETASPRVVGKVIVWIQDKGIDSEKGENTPKAFDENTM
jgi:hypothetical protein